MVRFECYKSFNESHTYSNEDGEEIVISTLWRYAQIDYQDKTDIPIPDDDGNYYGIFLPDEFEYSDAYVESVDLYISDDKLKQRIDDYEGEEFIEFIEGLGFESSDSEFDIIITNEDSLKITDNF